MTPVTRPYNNGVEAEPDGALRRAYDRAERSGCGVRCFGCPQAYLKLGIGEMLTVGATFSCSSGALLPAAIRSLSGLSIAQSDTCPVNARTEVVDGQLAAATRRYMPGVDCCDYAPDCLALTRGRVRSQG